MTDKRLLCAASMVRRGSVLADIGTDHAHLPVLLVENGTCPRAIAADIGEGPAASARRTVATAGLEDRIDVRVGDGLRVLLPDEANDIVIAGMGGETIIHILRDAPWLKDGEDRRLILQPMTKTVELREWLLTNGFVIETERLVSDGRHLYCVMAARFVDSTPPKDPLSPYLGALSFEEGLPYFEQQVLHLNRCLLGLRASDPEKASRLEQIVRDLEDYIQNGKETR